MRSLGAFWTLLAGVKHAQESGELIKGHDCRRAYKRWSLGNGGGRRRGSHGNELRISAELRVVSPRESSRVRFP